MKKQSQLYDKEKVIVGLVIFFLIVTFPFWYNHGKAAPAPELKLTAKAKAAKECVRDKAFMKAEHMQLLDIWRNAVVRDGLKDYKNTKGKTFTMSLSNTCIDCHSNTKDFCDKCHNYASVTPYCWDCHIQNPTEQYPELAATETTEQAAEGSEEVTEEKTEESEEVTEEKTEESEESGKAETVEEGAEGDQEQAEEGHN